jgi:hypothetical protein
MNLLRLFIKSRRKFFPVFLIPLPFGASLRIAIPILGGKWANDRVLFIPVRGVMSIAVPLKRA